MADITNVNLSFLRKARGMAPLSRYAVQDDGTVLVSIPDELEVRTFHLVRFSERGKSQIQETYNVETLRRTELAPDGSVFIGTTDDDLYLFRQARKTRFLPDRRASYTDISLGATVGRFAMAYCDIIGAGHTVALGEIGGRLLWTKDVPFPVARVSVDRTAQHMAVAGEQGDLLLIDGTRKTLWQHRQEVPLLAVATIGPERTVFATGGPGVESGGVGLVGSDGVLSWFTELVGTPVELAIDAEGKVFAVLLALDASSGRLVFLSPEGLPVWDIELEESRPTGLSLSPSGRFAAVTLRDGSLITYELTYGERMVSLSEEAALAETRAARDSGNIVAAVEVLRSRLESVPSDVRSCALLVELQEELKQHALTAAQNAELVGDFAEADSDLAGAQASLPTDSELTVTRAALRVRWHDTKLSQGELALSQGNGEAAEAAFLEAIRANPLSVAARTKLADSRYATATAALERGRGLLAIGDAKGALVALTEARQKGASGPELAELVRQARVQEGLAFGNRLYQDRQYAAALFEFRNVLRLDPDNAEALQKLSYAKNFHQDTQLSDRFTRLE